MKEDDPETAGLRRFGERLGLILGHCLLRVYCGSLAARFMLSGERARLIAGAPAAELRSTHC